MSSAPLVSHSVAGQPERRPNNAAPARRKIATSKRFLDLIVASTALVMLSPLIAVSALLIRLTSVGPVFFRQMRVGQGEEPFAMLKLRTMHVGRDDSAHRDLNRREILGESDPGTSDGAFKLEHDPRITKVGRFLRRFSIDELPQLFNVLKGEMSLVGPRPSLPWEVELYSAEQRRRHQCVPGITGLWQVSGRNRLSMIEMLNLDLVYVERQSLLLDFWILLRTPSAVFFDRSAR